MMNPTLSPTLTGHPSFAIFRATSTWGALTSYSSGRLVRVFHMTSEDLGTVADPRSLTRFVTYDFALLGFASSRTSLRTSFWTFLARLDQSPLIASIPTTS